MYYFVKNIFEILCSIIAEIVFALPSETLMVVERERERRKTINYFYFQHLKALYYKADEAGCRFYYPAAQIQKATGNNILLA